MTCQTPSAGFSVGLSVGKVKFFDLQGNAINPGPCTIETDKANGVTIINDGHTITTIDKNGHIIESKQVSEAEAVDDQDTQIASAENGEGSPTGDADEDASIGYTESGDGDGNGNGNGNGNGDGDGDGDGGGGDNGNGGVGVQTNPDSHDIH